MSNFLNLPAELRDNIYKYCFSEHCHGQKEFCPIQRTPLVDVCTQIREEIKMSFWKHNHGHLKFLPDFVSARETTRILRQKDIWYSCEAPFSSNSFARFDSFVITITSFVLRYWYTGLTQPVVAYFEDVMEHFVSLPRLPEVIFRLELNKNVDMHTIQCFLRDMPVEFKHNIVVFDEGATNYEDVDFISPPPAAKRPQSV